MFDFHMHSHVSYDAKGIPFVMAQKAREMGVEELCFTDHVDRGNFVAELQNDFRIDDYIAAYNIEVPGLKIRRGVELGLQPDNVELVSQIVARYPFDFVIGSVHYVDGLDIYYDEYWQDKTAQEAERKYFQVILDSVKSHNDFDVLGHLTYIGKLMANPARRSISCDDYRQFTDEILRILVEKGKGIEINTSGYDRCGAFMPDRGFLLRFKELGGQIVTVGSDAHNEKRVGQYCKEACCMVQEIFGYVCTFAQRKPIFHKI